MYGIYNRRVKRASNGQVPASGGSTRQAHRDCDGREGHDVLRPWHQPSHGRQIPLSNHARGGQRQPTPANRSGRVETPRPTWTWISPSHAGDRLRSARRVRSPGLEARPQAGPRVLAPRTRRRAKGLAAASQVAGSGRVRRCPACRVVSRAGSKIRSGTSERASRALRPAPHLRSPWATPGNGRRPCAVPSSRRAARPTTRGYGG